jgi:hypothetical protein
MATSSRRRRSATVSSASARPRTHRTRPDPFAAVQEEIHAGLAANPQRTAKSILQELQQRYPGRDPDGQLRTLQHRVKE